jgi:hypothetical protein
MGQGKDVLPLHLENVHARLRGLEVEEAVPVGGSLRHRRRLEPPGEEILAALDGRSPLEEQDPGAGDGVSPFLRDHPAAHGKGLGLGGKARHRGEEQEDCEEPVPDVPRVARPHPRPRRVVPTADG